MSTQDTHMKRFSASVKDYALPKRFTYPFYHEPHPLCVLAASELQEYLKTQTIWEHNFGLNKKEGVGKMFGVLLVRNKKNELGYLSAFSGKLAGLNHLPGFVPPVYDMLKDDGFYKTGEAHLNEMNKVIEQLESNPKIIVLQEQLQQEKDQAQKSLQAFRDCMIENRKARKRKRIEGQKDLNAAAYLLLKEDLAKQSVKEKSELKEKIKFWNERVHKVETDLDTLLSVIKRLKKERKEASNALQQKLFSQYHFLNRQGRKKDLLKIFKETPQEIPPAAAGECAAPKLLQYAFSENLEPLAFAEFWWGAPPKSSIRKHKQFYPACQGKCQPILKHMLEGMDVDENPLLINATEGKPIVIVHEDEDIVLINKPPELLSVPGKNIEDSVYSRMKISLPNAKGPLIVHRLDMSTSGLMIIAKTKQAHAYLQRQFIKRTIKKQYVALLNGTIKEDSGIIELPLRLDVDDRPRQLVCHEFGKPATTKWEVVDRKAGRTKIHFYPITGRTHQLRVHAAHSKGLNTSICGDDLYGEKSKRLYLHAEAIEFKHPSTKEVLRFEVAADF